MNSFINYNIIVIVQVSLAIRGGYVLSNSKNREYQNQYFRPNSAYIRSKIPVFPRYSRFWSLLIVKTANTKTANSEGRLYMPLNVVTFGRTKSDNINQLATKSDDIYCTRNLKMWSFWV